MTHLNVVLAGPLAQPAGAAEAVGVVHDQYHIDQQPDQRRQQHDPARVGTNLAPKHSRVVDVGHYDHRGPAVASNGVITETHTYTLSAAAGCSWNASPRFHTRLIFHFRGFFSTRHEEIARVETLHHLTCYCRAAVCLSGPPRDQTCETCSPERFRPLLAINRNWISLTHHSQHYTFLSRCRAATTCEGDDHV